jgi:hypothetical protein
MVLRDFWLNQVSKMRSEAFVGPFLVFPHLPRIARHIGGEDRGETAFDGLLHGFPQRRES